MKLVLIAVLATALAVHATGDDSGIEFPELDVGHDTFFWNTTGHTNPVLSQAAASLQEVAVPLSGGDATGDYFEENSTFDARRSYDTVPSVQIRFTSEPPGLSVIVR